MAAPTSITVAAFGATMTFFLFDVKLVMSGGSLNTKETRVNEFFVIVETKTTLVEYYTATNEMLNDGQELEITIATERTELAIRFELAPRPISQIFGRPPFILAWEPDPEWETIPHSEFIPESTLPEQPKRLARPAVPPDFKYSRWG